VPTFRRQLQRFYLSHYSTPSEFELQGYLTLNGVYKFLHM